CCPTTSCGRRLIRTRRCWPSCAAPTPRPPTPGAGIAARWNATSASPACRGGLELRPPQNVIAGRWSRRPMNADGFRQTPDSEFMGGRHKRPAITNRDMGALASRLRPHELGEPRQVTLQHLLHGRVGELVALFERL